MTVKRLHQQSLFDIAIGEYGDVKAVFDLTLSNQTSMTDDRMINEAVFIGKSVYTDRSIRDYYKRNEYIPATDLSEEQSQEINPQGISYWAINIDFIVS